MSRCKWPETFQSSWLLCNNNTSRVAAGTRYSTPSVRWMRRNHSPGMWPCSEAVRPSLHPHQPSVAGGGQARLEGQLYFQGMTNCLCWLGESTYLPLLWFQGQPAGRICFVVTYMRKCHHTTCYRRGKRTSNDVDTKILLLTTLQPPGWRRGHSIPLRRNRRQDGNSKLHVQ